MFDDDKRRQEKMKQLEIQQKSHKEDKNLTFKPLLMNSGEFKRRDFTTFYQDQIQYKAKVDNTINQKIEQQFLHQYVISKNAHVKANKKSDQILKNQTAVTRSTVHMRLFRNESLLQKTITQKSNTGPLSAEVLNITPKQKSDLIKLVSDRLFRDSKKKDEQLKTLTAKWDSIAMA